MIKLCVFDWLMVNYLHVVISLMFSTRFVKYQTSRVWCLLEDWLIWPIFMGLVVNAEKENTEEENVNSENIEKSYIDIFLLL
jgi:hypothetical protein